LREKEIKTYRKLPSFKGWKLFINTVKFAVYAHMQATGMVNDHIENCWTRKQQAVFSDQ